MSQNSPFSYIYVSTSFPPLPWNRTHQQIATDSYYRYQDGTLLVRSGNEFVRIPSEYVSWTEPGGGRRWERVAVLSPADRTRMMYSDDWRDDRRE